MHGSVPATDSKLLFLFCSDYDEWSSDSSFEVDEDALPVKIPKYIAALYKGTDGVKKKFPFEVVKQKGRLFQGYFFSKNSVGEYTREDHLMWIKKKHFVSRLALVQIIERGSQMRRKNYFRFSNMAP